MNSLLKIFGRAGAEMPASELLSSLPPSAADWRRMLPRHSLASLLPWEAWDTELNLFFTAASRGFIFELAPPLAMDERLAEALSSLLLEPEEGDSLQWCLYASPDIAAILRQWRSVGPDQLGLVNRREEFYSRKVWSQTLEGSLILRDFRLVGILQRPLAKGPDESLVQLREKILKRFESAGVPGRVWGADDHADILDTLVNPRPFKQERIRHDPLRLFRDALPRAETGLTVKYNGLGLHTASMVVDLRSFVPALLPTHWEGWQNTELLGSMQDDNLRYDCPFLISLSLSFPDSFGAQNSSETKALYAERMHSSVGRYVPFWGERAADWRRVSEELKRGGRLVRGVYQLVLFAPTRVNGIDNAAAGNDAESRADGIYGANGWRLTRERFIAPHAWLHALPGGATPASMATAETFKRTRTLLNKTAANFTPFAGEWKGTREPLMLFAGRRGQLFHWSPWASDSPNYNISVAAVSGAGKSVLIQELIFNVLRGGGRVWVFDKGRSYERLCRLLGGSFIDLKQAVSLNPFSHVRNWDALDSDRAPEQAMVRLLFEQMAHPEGSLSPQESGWLEQALNEVWRDRGREAEVSHVYERLRLHADPRCRDLADALWRFGREGSMAPYFRGPAGIDLGRDFVVLELGDIAQLDKAFKSVVTNLLILQIVQEMFLGRRGSRQQLCVIDEAWDLLSGGSSGDFIVSGYRTARKYGGSFCTITQGLEDYYRSEAVTACLSNSAWKLLMQHSPGQLRECVKKHSAPIPEKLLPLLETIRSVPGQYSEIGILGANGCALGRLLLDPWSQKLYTTRSEEVAAIEELRRSGATLAEALDQAVAQDRRSRGRT